MSDYSVQGEPDYARDYDEDDLIEVRKGDVRAVLDVATLSMDFASGFLVEEQVEALRRAAVILDIDPIVVTPSNFVCKYTGTHDWHAQEGVPMGWRTLTVDRSEEQQRAAAYEALMAELTEAKAARKAAVGTPDFDNASRAYAEVGRRVSEWRAGDRTRVIGTPVLGGEPLEPQTWWVCWRCDRSSPVDPTTEGVAP